MKALKTGSVEQQNYWSKRNVNAENQIASLRAEAEALNETDKTRSRIIDTINRMQNAQDAYNQKIAEMGKKSADAKLTDYLKKAKDLYSDLQTAVTQ